MQSQKDNYKKKVDFCLLSLSSGIGSLIGPEC